MSTPIAAGASGGPERASLRRRLLGGTALLTAAALLLAWWLIAGILERFVAARFDAEKTAVARAVMAGSAFDAGGFAVEPAPADPRFEAPGSAWVWQVSDGAQVLARSPSLLSADLGPDGRAADRPGRALDRLSLAYTAPGDGRALRVTVALPSEEQDRATAAATRPLALALAVLGIVLLAAQWAGVTLGLGALAALQRDLARLARGEAERLPRPPAEELAPLADQINHLLDANRATVQRARAHVGNLAHALKTPLAVLRNRAQGGDVALLEQMERSVRWHLQRARAAGPTGAAAARTPLAAVLDDLRLVLAPAAARRGVRLDFDAPPGLTFAGEREDLAELLGNLLDNAVAWALGRVQLAARLEARRLHIVVSDDGPGIPAEARDALLARGARLDESKPGSGLGLAIVADLVALYAGRLQLADTPGGGLAVTVELPG